MRVLHAIHDFLPRHRAGSEIYADTLCRALVSRGHEAHVLCADYDPTRPHASLDWRFNDDLPITELINNWAFSAFEETYCSEEIRRQLEHVLKAVAPDILHVHNLLNLSFELPSIAGDLGIPSVATLHEYCLLCPSGGQRVHLAEHHVCTEIEPDRCVRCFGQSQINLQIGFASIARKRGLMPLARRLAALIRIAFPALFNRLGSYAVARAQPFAISSEDILNRQREAKRVFEAIDLFVAPSPALGREFRRFGMPADKLVVSDYGFVPLEPKPRPPRGERLRVGFVGTLVWHKGAHILVDALRQLDPSGIEILLFGETETFPAYSSKLRKDAAGLPIRFMGGFSGDQAAEVYAQMDVLVIASLWPENSPLVIHEAYMAGLPVIGSDMGGTADLIEHGVCGLLYDAFSPDSLAAALKRVVDEPDLLDTLVAGVPPVKTIDQDAEWWESKYRDVIRAARR